MKRLLLSFVILHSAFVITAPAADIVALCIGNNAYVTPEDVLDTPVNDARLMHQTLRAVPGVQAADIVLLEDARRSQITLALRQFKARAAEAKLALIFYSGHGVEDTPTGYDRAETFLLPVDAVIDSADDLPDKAVPLKTVLEALEGTRGAARGVILDCCRSGAPGATKSLARAGKNLSALDESVKKALGGAILPEGTLIAFATSPGRKAAAFLKEADTNSPFTYFIAEQISAQGGDLFSIVNAASRITKQRTEMRQVPHMELRGDASLITDFAFPSPNPVVQPVPEKPGGPVRNTLGPFTNSLGMRFIPVAITPSEGAGSQILFSIWETRRKDFEAFSDSNPSIRQEWKNARSGYLQVGHEPDHPVSLVSHEDAELFCQWLTKRELTMQAIPMGAAYRLPTDHEWSCAVGVGHLEDPSLEPKQKDRQIPHVYPWGDTFPPPNGVGNYADQTHQRAFGSRLVPGLDDGYPTTAPVGSFAPNKQGLFDMGGNVMEWCSGFYSDKNSNRFARGGCWFNQTEPYMLSSDRVVYEGTNFMNTFYGFRVVLQVPSN